MTGFEALFRCVDVSTWIPDEDNPIHPVGSQPKRVLICPKDMNDPGLIPGHKYLFKVPPEWKQYQTWSEFIASRLGSSIGVDVPRCFIAHDADGNMGALIEFFFGHAGQLHPRRFVHASDLLRKTFTNEKLGKPHSARVNILVCQRLLNIDGAAEWWGKTLTLDALIGNTDRHPDNWGFLVDIVDGRPRQIIYSLAPAFDNGTSLGYEFPDDALEDTWSVARLQRYIGRGTHHCGWTGSERKPVSHVELCGLVAQTYPKIREVMLGMLQFELARIADLCHACETMNAVRRFTRPRSRLVCSLVQARQHALAAAFGAL